MTGKKSKKTPVQVAPDAGTKEEGIWTDQRFAHLVNDPRFKGVPRKEKKIKIDKRFQSMFNDTKFTLKSTYDKYGRRVDKSAEDDLKKFYDIQSEGEDDEEPADDPKPDDPADVQEEDQQANDSLDSDNEGDIKGKLKERLQDLDTDYARGEGLILTDSSSDDDDSDSEGEGVAPELFIDHAWGELHTEAPMTDESTRRLAACNMDWDKMRAEDIWVLCNSFLPPNSSLVRVAIYPSEFGKQRMKEEEEIGPQELVAKPEKGSDDDDSSGIDDLLEEDSTSTRKRPKKSNKEQREGEDFHMEKLRQYQLNRLKYYYAVIECDRVATADKLYAECDGLEYESSATKLDLRFIPDDMEFEDEPREECTAMPNLSKYQPRMFQTSALQSAKVDLTWDETAEDRKEFADKLKEGKLSEISDVELRKYLACSSDEEEEGEPKTRGGVKSKSKKTKATIEVASGSSSEEEQPEDSVQKYRDLLAEIKLEDEKKANRNIGMEFSWDVRAGQEKDSIGGDDEAGQALTPFEKLIEKQKKKKQVKLSKKKAAATKEDKLEDSDDDIPDGIDMNDPYFAEEFASGDFAPKKSELRKKSVKEQRQEEEEDKERRQAELALLLDGGDGDQGRSHFSLKKIQRAESAEEATSKRKRKRLLKKSKEEILERKQKNETADGFEINLEDTRFGAIYSSHLYNIDPTDPNFKKTKVMEKIISEKLKRKKDGEVVEQTEEVPVKKTKQAMEKVANQMLVNKLKRKLK